MERTRLLISFNRSEVNMADAVFDNAQNAFMRAQRAPHVSDTPRLLTHPEDATTWVITRNCDTQNPCTQDDTSFKPTMRLTTLEDGRSQISFGITPGNRRLKFPAATVTYTEGQPEPEVENLPQGYSPESFALSVLGNLQTIGEVRLYAQDA